jgi:hypothetical protein
MPEDPEPDRRKGEKRGKTVRKRRRPQRKEDGKKLRPPPKRDILQGFNQLADRSINNAR